MLMVSPELPADEPLLWAGSADERVETHTCGQCGRLLLQGELEFINELVIGCNCGAFNVSPVDPLSPHLNRAAGRARRRGHS